MRNTTKALLVVPAAVATAALAGCGSSSKASAPPTTPLPSSVATVTDTVVPPVSSTSAPAGPQPCTTAHLAISLGEPQGAAGSTVEPLIFTNKGAAACTLAGFPGVSFVAPATGQQVGSPAQRDGGSGAAVTVAGGGSANAQVRIVNYQNVDPSSCAATAASGLRVYPPGNTAAAYVPFTQAQTVCTNGSGFFVQTLRAGSGQ